ncbi:hypothetical protein ACSBOB_18580 [Mesorhizobium sp. ASY16-5R]|uniref:hypothetical protein n=1 Tax=Mesorhizobium sp. ASY16-5R TaxID=3445772 RepID=UPI003F9ED609
MSRSDRRGNRVGGPAFVQIFHWIRKTEAWRSLSPYSRLLYIEMRAKFSGTNNGGISMSYREAADLLGCSNGPVITGFRELQDRGFMVAVQKGSFSWKVRFGEGGRATTWRLTELPQDYPERSLTPTYEFKTWVPSTATEKKARRENLTRNASYSHAISDDMASDFHANGVNISRHSRTSELVDGVKISRTSISTISLQPVGQISSAVLNSPLMKRAREEAKRQSKKTGAAK